MIVTLDANLVKKRDSSIAESPPPLTMTSFFLKKAPSHVAHVATPPPLYLSSEGFPSHLAHVPAVLINSGPGMPCSNPGKFSTSVVKVNCPPSSGPEISRGERFARAA